MAAAGKFKLDVKSNAQSVLAFTREVGRLLPAAQCASLVNIALGVVHQVDLNSIVLGQSTRDDSWYAMPIPGADHPTAKPTANDFKSRTVVASGYTRNAKGQILSRTVQRVGPQLNYLFKDKVVSRTGELHDDLSFDMEAHVLEFQLDPQIVRDNFFLESNLGGLQIAAQGPQVILKTTNTNDGQKIATLEKRGIQSGTGRPRYMFRKALISATKRYSTAMAKELAKAEKLGKAAAARVKQ